MCIYNLMHKNIRVLEFKLDVNNHVTDLIKINNTEHLPIALQGYKTKVTEKSLNEWINSRCIPLDREDIETNLRKISIRSPQMLITSWFFTSLSDQYWIRNSEKFYTWEDVNLFTNSFTDTVGEVLIGNNSVHINAKTPDASLGGQLKKKWKIVNDKRQLFKMGKGETQQEVFNECIATEICKRMNFYHVPYHVENIGSQIFSVCDCFINPSTELVSAWDLLDTIKNNPDMSIYEQYLELLQNLELRDAREKLDNMLLLDFIMGNIDRHFNNFGVIRHSETLDIISIAPIFDTGTSLFSDKPAPMVDIKRNSCINSFETTEYKQFILINTKYNFEPLCDITDWTQDFLTNTKYVYKEKIEKITEFINYRIDYAKKHLSKNK